MAAKTGNLAIEIFNSRSLTPSGLTCTQAELWAIVLDENEIYITLVSTLKKFTEETTPYKFVSRGGDGNASLLIFQKVTILPIFHNISSLSHKELCKLLKGLLDESK